MKLVTVPMSELPDWAVESVKEGYQYGCSCGEAYRTREAAESCKKCRQYLTEAPTTVYYTPLCETEAPVPPSVEFYRDADFGAGS